MTITLTIEELREYQQKCEEHIRLMLEANTTKQLADEFRLPSEVRQFFLRDMDRIKDALKKNPVPKLIPDA